MKKMNLNNINKILVLVEMDNGNIHQVLASRQQKEIALRLMKNEKKDSLMLSEEIEPIKLKSK